MWRTGLGTNGMRFDGTTGDASSSRPSEVRSLSEGSVLINYIRTQRSTKEIPGGFTPLWDLVSVVVSEFSTLPV